MSRKLLGSVMLGGLIGSLVFILFFTIIYQVYENPFLPEAKSPDFFVYLGVLVGALVTYRFWVNAGQGMRFWEGLILGLGITFLMATLSAIFIYIFLSEIDPQVLTQYKESLLEAFTQNKTAGEETFGKKEYSKIIQDLQNTSASQMAWYELRVKLLIGSVMSFVLAAVLRH